MSLMFYRVLTFGCQMNVRESEKIAGIAEEAGYLPCEKNEDADLIVLNTCCIRNTAEQKIVGALGRLKALKEKKKGLKIVVAGCMSQQTGKADYLIKKFPYVDAVLGAHNIARLREFLGTPRSRVVEISDEGGIDESLPSVRGAGEVAYVNVIYGCDNYCSYCIVPFVKGRERSRKREDILAEVKELIGKGYKTITLLGQNVNSYGKDLGGEYGFAELLEEAAKLPGEFKISFMTNHPKDFSDKLISVIAAYPDKIDRRVHLPLQAGSDAVLKRMNRGYTTCGYERLVNKIRAAVPGVKLTTDLMTGFPAESEREFTEGLAFIAKMKFDDAYTYIYSPRDGTAAAAMDGQISKEVKKERIIKLIKTIKNTAEGC